VNIRGQEKKGDASDMEDGFDMSQSPPTSGAGSPISGIGGFFSYNSVKYRFRLTHLGFSARNMRERERENIEGESREEFSGVRSGVRRSGGARGGSRNARPLLHAHADDDCLKLFASEFDPDGWPTPRNGAKTLGTQAPRSNGASP
jgi:hypothetical protein